MKFLYYTSLPWPHLAEPFPSFPHTNAGLDPALMNQLLSDSVALLVAAERAGFDWLGVGEEHMNAYGVAPNPTLVLSAVAALTSTASLAVLGNPIPLLNPLRVAEEYAWLDALSGGRLVAGFPRGVPQNFAAYGLDSADSRERLAEGIALVREAWTAPGPFAWEGTYYRYPSVSIWPQPMHNPTLVMSCKSAESVRIAVQHRAVMAEIYVKNREVLTHFSKAKSTYVELATADGWQPSTDNFCLSLPCVIAENDADAMALADRALGYQATRLTGSYEREKRELTGSYFGGTQVGSGTYDTLAARLEYGGVICGSPATVLEQINQATDTFGVGILGLQMQFGNLSTAEIQRGLELFATEVRPHVR
ncbi:LLM class flavin-dependent oxidoreductase [Rhodococcus opacus]|uniref:LLM class flavin-dependent oxidoreductase n=1 Tax=Rhodococcus opacus TaxID=37919 RepID=UPI001F5722A6|nr:LLM class flavin-dependent oxidoreductase [Rhodococcus opacus]UNN05227.1 LLM class flavin-dependent oxidoreductase [Rhodococcus opacus]